jgi:hypothetical protein
MVSPVDALTPKVQAALRAALGEQYAEVDPVIRPSQYADLQVNVALALAKQVGMPPRALATAVVEHLDLAEMASSVEVSGPGFINVTLSPEWISAAVSSPPCSFTSDTTTQAPSRANTSAMARPMPDDAPVTSATLFFSMERPFQAVLCLTVSVLGPAVGALGD